VRFRSRKIDPKTGRIRVDQLRKTQIGSEIYPKIEKLIEAGVDTGIVVSLLLEVAESVAPEIKAKLDRSAPRMLRMHRRSDRKFQRRVRKLWGPQLDALYEAYVGAEELGWNLQALHKDERDATAEALTGLHLAYTHVRALSCERFILFYRTDFPWLPSLVLAPYMKPL
jgi:hypothetical protein